MGTAKIIIDEMAKLIDVTPMASEAFKYIMEGTDPRVRKAATTWVATYTLDESDPRPEIINFMRSHARNPRIGLSQRLGLASFEDPSDDGIVMHIRCHDGEVRILQPRITRMVIVGVDHRVVELEYADEHAKIEALSVLVDLLLETKDSVSLLSNFVSVTEE